MMPFAWPHIRAHWPLIRRNWKTIAWIGFWGTGLHNAFAYVGLHYTTATNGVILNSSIPIMIIVTGWLVYRDTITRVQALGVAISLGGRAGRAHARRPRRAREPHAQPGRPHRARGHGVLGRLHGAPAHEARGAAGTGAARVLRHGGRGAPRAARRGGAPLLRRQGRRSRPRPSPRCSTWASSRRSSATSSGTAPWRKSAPTWRGSSST